MKKLLKHIKPFGWFALAIVVLLFGQAMAELSLPGYMANIVNVGIQQNGIENAVPEAIGESEFSKLTLFMTESEKETVAGNYILLSQQTLSTTEYNKYLKTYPQLDTTSIYKLDTDDKTEILQLNDIFSKVIPPVYALEQDNFQDYAGDTFQIPEGVDPFELLNQLPSEQLAEIFEIIETQTETLPDTMLEQLSVAYLHEKYTELGMDIGKIQRNYMFKTGAIMLLLTVGSVSCAVSVAFLAARVAAGMGLNMRKQLFERVESFSNTEFDKFSTASLITRTTNDITQVQLLMVMLFRVVFYSPMMGVGGVIKVINADTSMIWIIAAAIGSIFLIMFVTFTIAVPKFKAIQKLVDKLNLIMREILSGLMVIRAFNTQKHEENRFDIANKELTKTNLFVNRIMITHMPINMLLMNGVMVIIIWIGAHQVDAGTVQVGSIMAFTQYAMMIIMSFFMVSIIFIMLPRAIVSTVRISEVLETEPVIKDPEKPLKFQDGTKGLLEFQDVSFRYPNAEDYVLKNITFTTLPGKTTAIIGSTGSGKSTLINLIPRFYDVTRGKVLVDGVDVREVTQHDLRDKLGYVPQKAVLFSGTIESNIKYADENASDEELIKYVETAQASDFITKRESGFEAPVTQGGTNLSGGQRQRLSIARALAKKPEIFIFDDSLSALDYKTDMALRKALKKETAGASVIIVTQRVSTVMGADQIIVLDEGQIAGIGTHKDLLENCNVYQEIALSQLTKEELT